MPSSLAAQNFPYFVHYQTKLNIAMEKLITVQAALYSD
jgi:hypothetical protein